MGNPEFLVLGSLCERLAPWAIAGCYGAGLWMSWECAGGSIPRPAPPTAKIRDISLFPRYGPVWGSPFWGCTPYFRGLYLRAQRELDKVPDM